MQPVSEHPDVQEAEARLADLRERKRALEEELRDARFGDSEPSLEEMADDVYAGGTATATDRRSAADVQRQIKATERAIQRARQEASRARKAARAEVFDEMRPRYREAQARMAEHARKLLAAAEEEMALEEELREAGVEPLTSQAVNRLPEGTLRDWLREAEDEYDV